MNTTETTVFKSFNSLSDLISKIRGCNAHIELSNGWFVPVTKKAITQVAKSMIKNGLSVTGKITYLSFNNVQIKLSE